MRISFGLFLFVLNCCWCPATFSNQNVTNAPSILIQQDRDFRALGGPIVINVHIKNNAPRMMVCILNQLLLPQLFLEPAQPDDNVISKPHPYYTDFSESLAWMEPDSELLVRVPLNQYFTFLKAGVYRFNYKLPMSYSWQTNWSESTTSAPPTLTLYSEGTFVVEIETADKKTIEADFEKLVRALQSTNEIEQDLFAKLISSTDSPLALPALKAIWEIDRTRSLGPNCKSFAIRGLGRIGTEEAREFLKAVVLSDPSVAEVGLEELAKRRIVLSLDEIRPFFRHGDPGIKYVALEYARKMGAQAYSTLVEALTLDPNPAIAAKAASVNEGRDP